MLVRLQKLISQAGITSRRKAETLITDGCVTVNGRIVTELGTKADPERDHIKVNGKLLRFEAPSIYLMLNKPAGFITTLNDPEGRPTVMNLVRNVRGRLYPVGRLDYHTEGLLLLTNDGALAHRLMHPSSGVLKRYHAKIKGVVDDDQIARLSRGVKLQDGTTAPCNINKLRLHEKNSWLEVILHEGRYRQVRRMFESIGRSVIKLRRVGYAGLTLSDLPLGQYRRLTPKEVESLRRVAARSMSDLPVGDALMNGGASERMSPPPATIRPDDRSYQRRDEASGWRERTRPGPSSGATGARGARGAAPQSGPVFTHRPVTGSRSGGRAVSGWRPGRERADHQKAKRSGPSHGGPFHGRRGAARTQRSAGHRTAGTVGGPRRGRGRGR